MGSNPTLSALEARSAARPGAVFVVLFVAAFVVAVGELVGTFADPDLVFAERFEDGGTRARDIAGSYLLALAGIAFAWFASAVGRDAAAVRLPLLLSGSAVAGGMLLAAVAWATVPLSRAFGALVDDPGLREGQAVLPQFGWVALAMGAMLPAAVFIVLVARTPGLVPGWLSVASYPAAALVAVTALLFFLSLVVFLAWVVAVAATHVSRITTTNP